MDEITVTDEMLNSICGCFIGMGLVFGLLLGLSFTSICDSVTNIIVNRINKLKNKKGGN